MVEEDTAKEDTAEVQLKAIDTHVHFWELESYRPYATWFGDKTFLERDYLPVHLELALAESNVESALIVGAGPNSDEHNHWCGSLVEQYESVCGLVGSYTFDHPDLPQALDGFAGKQWFVGIRAQPTSPPDQWTEDAQADAGMAALRERGLKLDILVKHDLLPVVAAFAQKHDDVPFIVNHCGLPPFRSENADDMTQWAANIRSVAAVPNVFMKYSSFFLHAAPHIQHNRLQFAADTLFEQFGVDRLLWGSNWPPELLGGTYAEAFDLMLGCAGNLSFTEYSKVFRENAKRVYGMNG